MFDTSGEIIDALGGTGAVAAALGQSLSTVSGWRSRGIPAPHWLAISRLAAGAGRDDIDLVVLADLAARKRGATGEVEEARV